MKRPLSLIAGIFSSISIAIFSLVFLVLLIISCEMNNAGAAAGVGEATALIMGPLLFVFLLIFAFLTTTMILNICSATSFSVDTNRYKSKHGVIITSIVFNFLILFVLFASLIGLSSALSTVASINFMSATGGVSTAQTSINSMDFLQPYMIYSSIVLVVLLINNVFYIVDLSLEGKRVKEYCEATGKVMPQTKLHDNIINGSATDSESANKGLTDKKFQQLQRLSLLHKDGIITDEEFSRMKSDILND